MFALYNSCMAHASTNDAVLAAFLEQGQLPDIAKRLNMSLASLANWASEHAQLLANLHQLLTTRCKILTAQLELAALNAEGPLSGPRYLHLKTLVINLDNGPENHSRRTQFIKRLFEFVDQTGLTVELAYYPPYHSKYNPIERCWGALEKHWNGSLLDELQVALDFIESMTWRGVHPVVWAATELYRTGAKLSKQAMELLEERLDRDPLLGKWFLSIKPKAVLG